jgi:hypothetical protein
MSISSLLIAVAIGFLSGLHASTWGMFKDAPHEGFSWGRYFRSAIVGAIMAAIAAVVMRPDFGRAGQLVLFFGLTYVLERGAIEFWKTFLRTEDQSKYFIPMQFAVFGRVVHSAGRRVLIGVLVAVVVIVAFLAIHWLTRGTGLPRSVPVVLAIASIGGWISAFLGAWKDAPVEGFETLKFFRSPVAAALYGLLLSAFTTSYLLIALAALGYTIATLETYKTFFFPSKPRGKFAGKPIKFPEMLERRKRFAVLCACIWALIITGFVMAFASRDATFGLFIPR